MAGTYLKCVACGEAKCTCDECVWIVNCQSCKEEWRRWWERFGYPELREVFAVAIDTEMGRLAGVTIGGFEQRDFIG